MNINENEKVVKNIQASLAIEGMFLEKSDIDLINSFLNKDITEKQGIEMIKEEFRNI